MQVFHGKEPEEKGFPGVRDAADMKPSDRNLAPDLRNGSVFSYQRVFPGIFQEFQI